MHTERHNQVQTHEHAHDKHQTDMNDANTL